MKTVGLGAQRKETLEVEKLSARIDELEKEKAALQDEVDSLKKKSKSSADKKVKTEADQDKDSEKE